MSKNDDDKPKPWYEDIKDRFRSLEDSFKNLDSREVVLQKQVASVNESVKWLVRLREEDRKEQEKKELEKNKKESEKGTSRRWVIGVIVSIILQVITIIIALLA